MTGQRSRRTTRRLPLVALLLGLAGGGAVLLLWLRPTPAFSVSVSFAGFTNSRTGALIATFAITNQSTRTIRRWDFCEIEDQRTQLSSEFHLGPDAYLAKDHGEVVALPAPTNQTPWRLTLHFTPDSWRRKVIDMRSRSQLLTRIMPKGLVPDFPVEHHIRSEWISSSLRTNSMPVQNDTTPIDELQAIDVNETKQWILCRGRDRSKPVVLFVHGGPGTPLMMYSRAFDDPFINDFVVVHWDQRGAGKSFDPKAPIEQLHFPQFVDDGLVVVEHLKRKFQRDKIVLVGHSWGTIVAFAMAARRPADFQSLVTVGTMTDTIRIENYRFNLLKTAIEASSDKAAANDLAELGPPPYGSHVKLERFGNLILKFLGFGGVFHEHTMEQASAAVLKNREYSEAELVASFEALKIGLNQLSDFVNAYVAVRAVPSIQVPVYFVQGQHDSNTPSEISREYFDALNAPQGKTWIEFEDAAHFAFYDNPERFLEVLALAAKPPTKRF